MNATSRQTPDMPANAAPLRRLALCAALAAGSFAAAPAHAQSRMTPEDFEAYVTGRTLVYNSAGQPYGIEEYLPGRRVRWAFSGDDCVEGYWYVEQSLICFEYENNLDPQCWSFEQTPSGLVARFEDSSEQAQLYETRQSSQPMTCYGPKVGS